MIKENYYKNINLVNEESSLGISPVNWLLFRYLQNSLERKLSNKINVQLFQRK